MIEKELKIKNVTIRNRLAIPPMVCFEWTANDGYVTEKNIAHYTALAEGVEQMQQVELLRKMGCDIIQGYHYSKPLPLEELLEFLQFWEVEHQERV